MKGRKDVKVDVTIGKSITWMMIRRKEPGKKKQRNRQGKSQRPGRCKTEQ